MHKFIVMFVPVRVYCRITVHFCVYYLYYAVPVLILHTYPYPFYACTRSRCTGVDGYFIVICIVRLGLKERGSWRAYALPGRQLRTQSKDSRKLEM